MVNSLSDFFYYVAAEEDFNELVEGRSAGPSYTWPPRGAAQRVPKGQFGVLCEVRHGLGGLARPCAIVVHEEDERRLFARYSQLRSDLSPLSAWVHIVRPAEFESIKTPILEADLAGLEAAWTGLVIAEAAILSRRSQNRLKQSACLATQTFTLARSLALWGVHDTSSVLETYDRLQTGIRGGTNANKVLRKSLEPIWSAMLSLSGARSLTGQDKVTRALKALRDARLFGESEASALQYALGHIPEAAFLDNIEAKGAEERLRDFDQLRDHIRKDKSSPRSLELSFLAGYLATIAAGGAPSFSIAEAMIDESPEILAFAYLIGGLGEQRSWSGGFEGLGRLVARELMRSCNLADGPMADFSANEANVLIDRALKDPLVFLKIKQSRIVNVSFMPGVNVQFALAETQDVHTATSRPVGTSAQRNRDVDPMATLAEALLPYLIDRLPKPAAKSQSRSTKKPAQKRLKL